MLVELWMWLVVVLMLALIVVQNIGLRERVGKLEASVAADLRRYRQHRQARLARRPGENRGQTPNPKQQPQPRTIIGV